MHTSDLDDFTDETFTPDGPIEQRLARLADLRQQYKAKEDEYKRIKDIHDALQAQLYEELRSRSMTGLPTDAAVYTCKETVYGNVNDMDAFAAWAEENGVADEFLKPAPEKRRLNEMIRDRIDAGEELPDGVNWYAREYISITSRTPKN